MIDITGKANVYREAEAEGFIKLRPETLERIRRGELEKGDVFSIATTAGMLAAKKAPELLPLCHPLPLTNISLEYEIEDQGIRVKALVKTIGKTGVEMEALTAVAIALLNIWDVVKKYEKDESGQYPYTEISSIKVRSKIKRETNEQSSQ